ncbi:PAS domain-containing sensor histidine kinase [Halalkalibacter kiskunsagensis]|uniref:histidine kinase n=1 Tax=Halalkalibacter kiskunsagensis TaxID=1548599 RepID=A0ABV6KK59_9BACI
MKNMLGKATYRSKTLLVLLMTIILLSSFSLILIHSINQISKVSSEISQNTIPELMWITHWEEELHIKKHIVEQSLLNGLSLPDSYDSYATEAYTNLQDEYGTVPESIEYIKREMDLLDFKIHNNVHGLQSFGDQEAVEKYLHEQYLPHLFEINEEIQGIKHSVNNSFKAHSNHFSDIINQSLWLLLFITIGAVTVSFIAAYRISASLTNPLESMVSKVDRIASGEYGLAINASEQVELKQLTASINQMSMSLKDSFETILNDKVFREQILNSLPVGIITVDERNSDISYNQAANNLLNTTDSAHYENDGFWGIFNSKQIIQNVKMPFYTTHAEYSLLVSQSVLNNQSGDIIGRIFYFIDITETEELEKRIRHSEKLAIVGELAAGAAHEIRNPLAVIDGFLSLMNQSFSDSVKQQYHIPLLLRELDRINSIIEEMLLLTKPSAPQLKETYMDDVINDILPLIQKSLKNQQIEITIDLHREQLLLDGKQMKQVFHNLIRNSIEAIEGKGKVSIYSKLDESCYQIYLEDNGKGIPSYLQGSIFHPFLTSKDSGTGLGLTIVQRIIDSHNGQIDLVSSSPKGTVFIISLPLNDEK